MTANKSANYVAARARRRLLAPPPDYPLCATPQQPVRKLIYEDMITGERHEFLLFISPDRVDQFRVMLDGKLWRERIGWTHILAGLRKAAGRFSNFTA